MKYRRYAGNGVCETQLEYLEEEEAEKNYQLSKRTILNDNDDV